MARVMVVDDHPIVRDGLKAYLSLHDDFEVVGEAADVATALAVARRTRPDVVLLDLRLAGESGLALIPRLRAIEAPPRVVVLSSFLDPDAVHEAMRLGASGYLLKHVGPGTLVDRMRAVVRGEISLDPAAADALDAPPAAPLATLSAREREVLERIVEGMSNKRIAQALGISERTVKTHVSHLLAKLGVRDRTQAAVLATARRGSEPQGSAP